MMKARNWVWIAAFAAFPLVGCRGLLDVENPGRIADAELDSRDAIASMVTGMSYDVARALNNSEEAISLLSVELYHGGSYNWDNLPRGQVKPEDVNGTWEAMFRPRYTTVTGITRIKSLLTQDEFSKSALVARAYMLAGFANRHIGENVCQTINPTSGAPEANTAEFDRGIENFNNAITIGAAAVAASSGAAAKFADSVVKAAYGGRATLKAWKGDWSGASADASSVPDNFVYAAPLMTDGLTNTLSYETHDRYEYTIWSTEFQSHPADTRAPWQIQYAANGRVAVGANGSTPMYQQEKYVSLGDNIPLTKGTEMLVLRAEAALRQNPPDISGAYTLMNRERAVANMPALTSSTDINQAWADLHFERMAVTFLEGRHLWDERRWFAEKGQPSFYDLPKTEGDPTATLETRDKCIPISKTELQSNPNIPKP